MQKKLKRGENNIKKLKNIPNLGLPNRLNKKYKHVDYDEYKFVGF